MLLSDLTKNSLLFGLLGTEGHKQFSGNPMADTLERELEIAAGSSAEPVSHPHLQEPVAPAGIQPQRYVNEVCTTGLDELIQGTARPELQKMLPPRVSQMRLRVQGF